MKVIYVPTGKALEYGNLACNVYLNCTHACRYCYCPQTLKMTRDKFFEEPLPRPHFLEDLEVDAHTLQKKGNTEPVFLSFIGDCYQPIDVEYQLTRKAIDILHRNAVPVMLLTKGGKRAERDFDLLCKYDWFGATLTFSNTSDSLKWEPRAALPTERVESLLAAFLAGIKTWVSLEPIIDPDQTVFLIQETAAFVDHYKVGKLNHDLNTKIDWETAIPKIKDTLDKCGCDYYIKKGTAKYLKERP